VSPIFRLSRFAFAVAAAGITALALLAACAQNPPATIPPTPTPLVFRTEPPPPSTGTPVAPTAEPTALASPLPSQPPPTEPPPTLAATSVPATAAPPTQPVATAPVGTMRVKFFLVAVGDNGQSGPLIGCGDSIIPVNRDVPRTNAPLRAALAVLLSLRDQHFGESGLYNALYQSSLTIENLSIVNGLATMRLRGQFQIGGVCDGPRVKAQLEETARQFSTVRSVSVFINGQPLDELLSGR
jgi:hypothetical protein